MKKIVFSLIILSIFLSGCDKSSTGDIPVEDNPDVQEVTKVVNITNDIGTNEITIDGITIKNVVIINEVEKKQLEFTIEGDQPLQNFTIEVALLNESVVNRKMNLKFNGEEFSKFVIIDFTEDYNNPYQIYFNIEK